MLYFLFFIKTLKKEKVKEDEKNENVVGRQSSCARKLTHERNRSSHRVKGENSKSFFRREEKFKTCIVYLGPTHEICQ